MKKLALILACVALAGVLISYSVVRAIPGPPTEAELAKIKAQGARVVLMLGSWHEELGEYPEAAEFDLPGAPYGGWRYEPLPDRTYSLELGDYEQYGFTLWWMPSREQWYLDA